MAEGEGYGLWRVGTGAACIGCGHEVVAGGGVEAGDGEGAVRIIGCAFCSLVSVPVFCRQRSCVRVEGVEVICLAGLPELEAVVCPGGIFFIYFCVIKNNGRICVCISIPSPHGKRFYIILRLHRGFGPYVRKGDGIATVRLPDLRLGAGEQEEGGAEEGGADEERGMWGMRLHGAVVVLLAAGRGHSTPPGRKRELISFVDINSYISIVLPVRHNRCIKLNNIHISSRDFSRVIISITIAV